MIPPIKPTWLDIHQACISIHDCCTPYCNPDYIVGLTRGGLIPATILSHLFNIPLIPLSYTSSVGKGGKMMYADTTLTKLPNVPKDSYVLFVDDLVDSGNTMYEVISFYKNIYTQVTSTVLYHKVGSKHMPFAYWKSIPEDAPWVVFPWEVE